MCKKKRNTDLINERGYYNLPNIIPQIGLELQAALSNNKYFLSLAQSSPKLISRIAHGLEPNSDGREQIINVFFVFSVIELTTGVANVVATGVVVRLEDVASLTGSFHPKAPRQSHEETCKTSCTWGIIRPGLISRHG